MSLRQLSTTKCSCGSALQPFASNIYRCPSCGRAQWADDSISGGMIVLIVVVAFLLILVLGFVGGTGQQFRA